MKTAVQVILRFYIGGDNSDEDSCESNIKVLYTGEKTLMKTAVKVILRFYIEGDNSDEDSCERNSKVLNRGW